MPVSKTKRRLPTDGTQIEAAGPGTADVPIIEYSENWSILVRRDTLADQGPNKRLFNTQDFLKTTPGSA